ncbi:hypothetical protein [Ideonella sp.]|uniref:hypothetical protein n=1 Tax=Ideonella sp. TaxID=1929293 RepID=UPI002B49BB8A|nr:hypothetical protein [Ideonella sp.]HJV68081.1 hypothetical protein [Ideonella sp.]
MVGELWKALLDYLKRTPYWPVIEPVALTGFLYAGVCIVSYQYLQWRYQVTLDLPLFLQSYLLRQVSVGFAALVGVFLALTVRRPADHRRLSKAEWALRIGLVLIIGATALFLLKAWSPESRVSPIRVRFAAFGAFAAEPDGGAPPGTRDKAAADYQHLRAMAPYLLYEINHRQRAWQLEFDTTPFRTDLVSQADEARCARDDTPALCIAEAFHARATAESANRPLVLITAQPLGGGGTRAWFWLNRGPVSVVTLADWGGAGSAGAIEYLAYALVVQSVMIHMQAHCGFTQPPSGTPEGVVVGNVFDLQPGIDAMRAAVLTGHFSPSDERQLLNCFGPEYMRTAVSLASLQWLRTAAVRETLRKVYGVELVGS